MYGDNFVIAHSSLLLSAIENLQICCWTPQICLSRLSNALFELLLYRSDGLGLLHILANSDNFSPTKENWKFTKRLSGLQMGRLDCFMFLYVLHDNTSLGFGNLGGSFWNFAQRVVDVCKLSTMCWSLSGACLWLLARNVLRISANRVFFEVVLLLKRVVRSHFILMMWLNPHSEK